MKPPIKDTPKEDKPPNKGQAKSTVVVASENDAKDKRLGPDCVHSFIGFTVYLSR